MKSRSLGLIFSIFCLSNVATAGSTRGFYAGVSAGVSNLYVRYNFTGNNGSNINNLSDTGSARPNGGLFAGYSVPIFKESYVATELYFLYQNTKVTNTVDKQDSWNGWDAISEKKSSYGIDFLAGTSIAESSPTSVYLRLGIENGKYEVCTPIVPGGGFSYTQKKKNHLSFVPGIGLKSTLSEKIFLRVEYSYVPGPTLKTYDSTHSWTHRFHFKEQRFMLSLGYQF